MKKVGMRMMMLVVSMLGLMMTITEGRTTAEWKTRTVYQLLTDRFASPSGSGCPNGLSDYCGGTFKAAVDELAYVQGMGFDAVWISPIPTNTPQGYHGYWAQDFNQVNAHFGTAQELTDMVSAFQGRGVWVMLDVVANHVGPVGYDYSSIVPFNQQQYYHGCAQCPKSPSACDINDYTCFTTEVQTCRLSGLPDLNQSVPFVSQFLTQWVQQTVQAYKFDGLRIDTVPEVDAAFWKSFQQAAQVYAVGEVFVSDMSCISKYAQVLDGLLSYPMYFTLRNVFQSGQSLVQINQTREQYLQNVPDPAALFTFVDNHDNARFLYQNPDLISYRAALAYVLMAEGIPCVYYGTEQGFNGGNDPQNREILWPSKYNTQAPLYLYLQTVVRYRNSAQVWLYPHVERTVSSQLYSFTRGSTYIALTNNHQTVKATECDHPYSVGQRLQNLFFSSDVVTVSAAGCFPVDLNNGEVKIFYPIQ